MFRQSALYREKWDRADYAARTIQEALGGRQKFYVWPDPDAEHTSTSHEGREEQPPPPHEPPHAPAYERLVTELAAARAELVRTRAELERERAARAESDRLVMHLRREQVAEDRILRQDETNDGDKVALIAFRRHLDRKSQPEKREADGSLLVCYGGVDETTGRAYGLGALIGRSADVTGERVRRLAGMGAWKIERHDNWNGRFGVTRVTMRETWTGTHRPWTIVPNETTTRGKQGGKRNPIRVCQNPACRSTDLEMTCRTCHTVQDGPPVYMDESEINAARQSPARNSKPGRQYDPPGEKTTHAGHDEATTGQVAPVCDTEEETGNLPPTDRLDASICSVAGCGGELEAYDAAGVPYCAAHAPPRKVG